MADLELTTSLLRKAYSQGFFPMGDSDTGEIYWFNPDPRAILPLDKFHLSRSLRRSIRTRPFSVTFDQDFAQVMDRCADRKETWITDEIKKVYLDLHREGYAHSVEVWEDGQLAGGVYGVALGGAFFGESMFHTRTDASKVALFELVGRLKQQGFSLLEVQFLTPHLKSLGAVEIPSSEYLRLLRQALVINAVFN